LKSKKSYHREIYALTLVEQLGSSKINQLLDHFESPPDIFRATADQLREIKGLGPVLADRIIRFDSWGQVDRVMERTEKSGITLLGWKDPGYPELLRQVYDAPPLLWLRGHIEALSRPGIAVVGTRSPDRYGREQADSWSRQLSLKGLSIVSGLAYGVDTLAHSVALEEGGLTTAVLGSGLNIIYPRENMRLAKEIIRRGGVLVSEYPPDTPPRPKHFPVRNRIVSGLSLGVLVIQSGVKGGSMITARSALDQNREVFIIPHALGYKRGEGNNFLIKNSEGKLVQTPEDLLGEIQFTPPVAKTGAGRDAGTDEPGNLSSLTSVQQELCNCLGDGSMQLDRLSEAVDISPGKLLNLLLDLELKGLVVQRAGKYFELR